MRALAALACAALLLGCPAPPRPAPRGAVPPNIALEGVTLRTYRGDRLELEATAPRVEARRESGELFAWDAGVRLPDRGLLLAAHHVTGNATRGHFDGDQGVRLATPDGLVGTSARASYDRGWGPQGGAASDAGVLLRHPRFTLSADAFAIDFASGRADFTRPVSRTTSAP